jgi:nickel-dependent lactate racemase
MEFDLAYGDGVVPFEIEDGRFDLFERDSSDEHPLTDAEIGSLIDDPIDSQPLEEIVSAGENVLVVVSDATRATASAQIVHLLVRRLIQLGVAPHDLRIIFANGIHRPVTREEKDELLSPFIVQRVRTFNHDAANEAKHVSLGETERRTPIELDRALFDVSHVILTGAIGFHYFAGFTGGRKSVCPGLASTRTIEATHLLALDFERGGRRAGVGPGRLDGNAVHEECERIAAEVAPSFLINTIVDEKGRAARLFAGDWRGAHRLACAEYAESHTIRISDKRPIVVVSAGGVPFDLNLIQAHKALEMASYACEEGGDIVLVAECRDGLGRPDFLKWFDATSARDLQLWLRQSYEVNGQTAWSLLSKAEAFRVHLVSSLPDDEVRRMRMLPARTIDEALKEIGTTSKGYIMPRGATFMPVVEQGVLES